MAVADIVAIVAEAVDAEDAPDKLRTFLVHGMDVELHEEVFPAPAVFALRLSIIIARTADAPHVMDGQIDQEIIVGLSHLQERLAAFDILHQERGIAPNAVGGTHIDRCIEFPSGPWIMLRGVATAMKEDVVDAA